MEINVIFKTDFETRNLKLLMFKNIVLQVLNITTDTIV